MQKIRDKGPTLVIIKSNIGNVFGGFANESWKTGKHVDFEKDSKAFLFSLTNSYKYNLIDKEKNAIYQHDYGIFFGMN